MKWTFFFSMLILGVSLCGCVGSPCGPCGPVPYGGYSGGGICANECDPCGTTMNYAYGSCATPYCGLPGAPIRTLGCGAAQIAATPASWLVQILRGSCYPCNGCGDERYWGDYGYVPGDYCSPCTPDGQWAGNEYAYGNCGGCGDCTVCQQGLSYRYPAVGTYMNQMYAPVFQDKISSTHAKTPLDYGLRAPYASACYDACCDPCGDTCCTDSCSTGSYHTGCDTCGGSGISSGYAPTRQRMCTSCGTGATETYIQEEPAPTVTTAAHRAAKSQTTRVAGKVYPPVKSQTYRR